MEICLMFASQEEVDTYYNPGAMIFRLPVIHFDPSAMLLLSHTNTYMRMKKTMQLQSRTCTPSGSLVCRSCKTWMWGGSHPCIICILITKFHRLYGGKRNDSRRWISLFQRLERRIGFCAAVVCHEAPLREQSSCSDEKHGQKPSGR